MKRTGLLLVAVFSTVLQVQAQPPKLLTQLVGVSRHRYQSGCSVNHGCSIEVWLGT